VAAALLGRRAVGGDRAGEAVELTAARLTGLTGPAQERQIVRVENLGPGVLP
jgi:hypothetical protein